MFVQNLGQSLCVVYLYSFGDAFEIKYSEKPSQQTPLWVCKRSVHQRSFNLWKSECCCESFFLIGITCFISFSDLAVDLELVCERKASQSGLHHFQLNQVMSRHYKSFAAGVQLKLKLKDCHYFIFIYFFYLAIVRFCHCC